jgi:hypothetical protein
MSEASHQSRVRATDSLADQAEYRSRISAYVRELTRLFRECGIGYVHAEYRGREGHGDFLAIEFASADRTASRCLNQQNQRLLILTQAIFRALLLARCPDWAHGDGSCGDFRWDLRADSLVHSHYSLGCRNERVTYHGV